MRARRRGGGGPRRAGAPGAGERTRGRGWRTKTKAWRESPGVVLGVLTGVNAFNYLDRYVGAAVLPLILAGLAISDAQGGLLQSVFVISYALVCPIAGWLGDRQNRLRLAATGVLVWSAATVASGLAPTFLLLLAARAIIGVGEASYSVVTPSLLSDYYTADRRAWALGVFYAATCSRR
jgi:MFS family permease